MQLPLVWAARAPPAPEPAPAPDPSETALRRYQAAARAHHDRPPGADWRATQRDMQAAWAAIIQASHLARGGTQEGCPGHTPKRIR